MFTSLGKLIRLFSQPRLREQGAHSLKVVLMPPPETSFPLPKSVSSSRVAISGRNPKVSQPSL
jgi:hypothetical protein